MLYSAYFAERAEHYRKFAERAPNGRQAQNKWALANLFLEMSWDMRLRESAVDPTVQRDQNGTRTLAKSTSLSRCRLWPTSGVHYINAGE